MGDIADQETERYEMLAALEELFEMHFLDGGSDGSGHDCVLKALCQVPFV